MNRREFLQVLAIAGAGGMTFPHLDAHAAQAAEAMYDLPRFGNVHLLHFTDCHAQLRPVYFREPNVNLGIGDYAGKPPHLVGEALLRHYGIRPGTAQAHAFTYLDFNEAARRYGKVGGFAHLATLVKRLKAGRPGALLLDGGDTWQGSATALWTRGQDMVDAALALGVDVMTPHWEMTLGAERVKEIVDKDFKGKVAFLAQNIKTNDFGDPVFDPYVIREINGVPVAIIGQAFPYTPIANPRYFVPDWTFGIQEENLQQVIDAARGKGAQAVVLLSHNGMDVDLKLASRVRGLDAILGGHTHDGVPAPVAVKNAGGTTLVTNAGSNGKFLGVLDFDVKGGKVADFRYRLLPVFANYLPADPAMDALISKVRAPYEKELSEVLAVNRGLLYRRGNFNGTFDQLILDGLMQVQGAQIAFSPGFRWGTTLLPGQAITMEHLMDQTAITYPYTTVTQMSGATIKTILEDVADNLFNPDPYYQQGGDMVRVGGLQYTIDPAAGMGKRITDMRLAGKPLDAAKTYKVAGWAPVAEEAREAGGAPVWDVMAQWLRSTREVSARPLNLPRVRGMDGNAGIAA
ncbi:putative periplasmic 5'-nucleotidase, putative soxB homolog [Cupriavidus taiwanensis]|uniref:Periplasmic 5'-nucleotidase, putative soxB homolog n=1 Tax=Cupriavidus taiwanensis TaxID=164546 RepID=A0A375E386_9BURK|nr:thiosulfohydrolase SoxB [Cupriavidus taiwanensis]SOZ58464.1 putative periplasmic 5'-nucleotidase, putative soxB homolog [Cupriavidus taiwanensis]SOZ59286.1 putative periplasmic 5'-nucleotidase, putative soxB homolog [Cupriavidus taiwanensis]SOZ62530.1 putative periplasmic 5'-nucleotidase, putative soxB homolog [Cupriavidus taiwanensis]SOZ99297.1 putative periplasmic 5'-nucleotidase, putative soxB homolog [Cupriavidus taiwanensis]SPA06189.1 putative periplasmic 5'-nucleotidase, putative soxB